jgi:hypothetical protein
MVIKYHNNRVLNDITNPNLKESVSWMAWMKAITAPLNQKQDQLNTQQDLIVRDMKHNGQQGVIDHMVNYIQYPDMAGKVYYTDVDFLDPISLFIDTETPATQIYLYTDDETGATYYTPTYIITDDESGIFYNSFRILLPDMYEGTDLEAGVEYYTNKYKPAGKTYDILYYSGTTTSGLTDNYTMFNSLDTLDATYVTTDTSILITDSLSIGVNNNHNLASTWTNITFFDYTATSAHIRGTTGTEPDTGTARSASFGVVNGETYRFDFFKRFSIDNQYLATYAKGVTVALYEFGSDSLMTTFGNYTNSGSSNETWVSFATTDVYIKITFVNTYDYDTLIFQYLIEKVGDEYEIEHKMGYEIGFDIVDIQRDSGYTNSAPSLAYYTGTTLSGYSFSQSAETYSIKLTGTTSGETTLRSTNYSNTKGRITDKITFNEVSNVSAVTLKWVNTYDELISEINTIIPSTNDYFEIEVDVDVDPNSRFYVIFYSTDDNSILDFDISFFYRDNQSVNWDIMDISGNSISNTSANFTEEGVGQKAYVAANTTIDGRFRLNVTNDNWNRLEIENITISKKDYSS